MSVNSHLSNTASQIIITDAERTAINNNIASLSSKLTAHFKQGQIKERLAFGSYTRKTLMPRKADDHSDVDYMVVFDTSSYTYNPDTYLRWLREFAVAKYATSEIYPSHPTVVLELSRIKIELVPAIKTAYGDDYQIPAPSSSYSRWLTTHPNAFNSQVASKNTAEKSLIRPMIRLMKYWNAKNDYPYSSYELEQLIVNQFYYSCNNLWDYIAMFVSNLSTYNLSSVAATNKVTRLKKICADAKTLETGGYVSAAESKIAEAFPLY
jgi:predicted nucleotidyltransferase